MTVLFNTLAVIGAAGAIRSATQWVLERRTDRILARELDTINAFCGKKYNSTLDAALDKARKALP